VLIDDPIAGSDLPRPDAIGHEVECSAERVCHPVPMVNPTAGQPFVRVINRWKRWRFTGGSD
jgi:hypothetical protein